MNALLSRIDPTDLEVETNRRTLLLSWVTVSLPPLPCIPSMQVDSISTHLWFCLNLQQNPRSILAGLFFAQTTVLLQSVWCLCVYFPWAPVYLLSFLLVSWQEERMDSDFWLDDPIEECGAQMTCCIPVSETWKFTGGLHKQSKHVLEGKTYTRPSRHPRHRPHNNFLFLIGLTYVRQIIPGSVESFENVMKKALKDYSELKTKVGNHYP